MIYAACLFLNQMLAARHTLAPAELGVFWKPVSVAIINSGVVWAYYIALEPWVRRSWPQT